LLPKTPKPHLQRKDELIRNRKYGSDCFKL